jgi:hypothetical protein
MVKLLSLACLVAAVTAVAVPNDDWKNYNKCPKPVTETKYETKYVPKLYALLALQSLTQVLTVSANTKQ